MSSFTTELVVSPMSGGRRWRLKQSFIYHVGSKRSSEFIAVARDFVTDFASFPGWRFLFWWLPYWAKYSKPAPLHDWLYAVKHINGKPITRKRADDIFLEAMLVAWRKHKSGNVIARMEYWAVRLFGWMAWR